MCKKEELAFLGTHIDWRDLSKSIWLVSIRDCTSLLMESYMKSSWDTCWPSTRNHKPGRCRFGEPCHWFSKRQNVSLNHSQNGNFYQGKYTFVGVARNYTFVLVAGSRVIQSWSSLGPQVAMDKKHTANVHLSNRWLPTADYQLQLHVQIQFLTCSLLSSALNIPYLYILMSSYVCKLSTQTF